MASIVFFILACLAPLGVMCDTPRFTPDTVPWPSQQCVDRDPQTVGICTIPADGRPTYRWLPQCQSLSCAVRRPDGTYELRRGIGKPIDGTLCGILRACHKGKCVDIDVDQIPTMTGIRDSFECRPVEAYLPPGKEPLVLPAASATRGPNSKRRLGTRITKKKTT